MASIIQSHNTNLLKDPIASTAKECSCQQKSNCSLTEKCLSECLVYHAQVDRSDINRTKSYYNTCVKSFKVLYFLFNIKRQGVVKPLEFSFK